MNLNWKRRAVGATLLLLGGLFAYGCSSGGDDNDGGTPKPREDAQPGVNPDAMDMTQADGGTNTTADALPRVDAGRRDGGTVTPCPENTEGCPCQPPPNANDPDPCETAIGAGASCLWWNDPGPGETLPPGTQVMASCVKACQTDGDCTGTNNICRDIGLFAGPVCVQAEKQVAEIANRSKRSGRTMSGCAMGLNCVGTSGTDEDQCSCGKPCIPTMGDPTGGCTAPRPVCNPRVFQTMTATVGICSERLNLPGSYCGTTDITKACDTTNNGDDNATICIGINGLLNQGTGLCMEICTLARPSCSYTDTTLGAAACNRFTNDQTVGIGICTFNNCTNFPDNCGSMGAGLGRTCLEGLAFGQGAPPLSFCSDVIAPVLNEVQLRHNMGMPEPVGMPSAADNCLADDEGPLHCPDNTTCIGIQQGAGFCLRGCATTATSTPDMRGGCSTASSTSSACRADFLMDPASGVCMVP